MCVCVCVCVRLLCLLCVSVSCVMDVCVCARVTPSRAGSRAAPRAWRRGSPAWGTGVVVVVFVCVCVRVCKRVERERELMDFSIVRVPTRHESLCGNKMKIAARATNKRNFYNPYFFRWAHIWTRQSLCCAFLLANSFVSYVKTSTRTEHVAL